MLTCVFDQSAARGSARLVLVVLADRADENGRCWPGLADIARRSGLETERAVRRALAKLVRLGEVTIDPGGGRGRTNVYTLRLPAPGPETRTGAQGFSPAGTPPRGAENPCAPRAKPLRAAPPNPDKRAGGTHSEPTVEPTVNPQGAPSDDSGAAAAVAAVSDPDAEGFNRLLLERQADQRHKRGGLTPKPLTAGGANPPATAGYGSRRRPDLEAAGPKRRIPEAEQERTFALLRGVPGLDPGDARDLARLARREAFEAALKTMPDGVRNPGGWLRTAVTQGWGNSAKPDSV
jgi:hypothetical protein